MSVVRRNAIANMMGRAVTAVLWVLVTPYALDQLGPERFGIWSLFFAFLSYLLAFDLGVSSTTTRFIAGARGSGDGAGLRRILRRGIGVTLALGVVWGLVVVMSRGWIAHIFRVPGPLVEETLGALVVFSIAVMLLFPAHAVLGALQGFERLDLSNACLVVGVGAQVATLTLGLALGGGLWAAALAAVVGQVASIILGAAMLRGLLRRVPGESISTVTGPQWSTLFQFGAALQIAGVLVMIQMQSGKFLLGLLGNLRMVSDYEVAFRVANAVGSMPWLLMGSLLPTVARAWESQSRAAVTSLFTSASRWLYALTVIALGLLWLLAPDLTRVWLGEEHDRIAELIRLWAMTYAVILVWGPGTVTARGIGIPWPEVLGLAASLVMNIGLSIWWIPRFGTAGAIVALGVSFIGGFILFARTFHPRSGIRFAPWFAQEFLPRLLAGVLTVALCHWLLASKPLASLWPTPGWSHAAVVVLLFGTTFLVLFAPLGDSQRLVRAGWQLVTALRARRRRPAIP